MSENDWVLNLKNRIKRNRGLATAMFYFTDLLYLDNRERNRFLHEVPERSKLINLGAGFRGSPPGFFGVDREVSYPDLALVADIARLPLRDGSVDGLMCEVVLEHVPDSRQVLDEIRRVLKPGGRLYLTVPFLFPYHASPHDYRRWTVSGLAQDLVGFDDVKIGLAGGPTMTLCNVLHEWLSTALSFNLESLYRLWYVLLIPLIFPFKLLDFILIHYRHAEKIAGLYYFHGRKAPSPS